MDICGFVLLHCMFRVLRDQYLAPLNCGVSFETLIFLENSHFIEHKVMSFLKSDTMYCNKGAMFRVFRLCAMQS